jgi:hypothetical protein
VLSSHGREREREREREGERKLSSVPSYEGINSIIRDTPILTSAKPGYFHNSPISICPHAGDKHQHSTYEFGGETTIQSITVGLMTNRKDKIFVRSLYGKYTLIKQPL